MDALASGPFTKKNPYCTAATEQNHHYTIRMEKNPYYKTSTKMNLYYRACLSALLFLVQEEEQGNIKHVK